MILCKSIAILALFISLSIPDMLAQTIDITADLDYPQMVDVAEEGDFVPPEGLLPVPVEAQEMLPLVASGDSFRVGILVPLSGEAEAIGRSIQDATEMALFEGEKGEDSPLIVLLPQDSATTHESAIEVLKTLATSKADLIIGPVFSHSSRALASLSDNLSIPVISLSNDSKLARHGLWVAGVAPEEEVRQGLEHAYARGVRAVVALVPDNALGVATVTSLEKSARALGIRVIGIEWYTGVNEGLSYNIRELEKAIEKEEIAEQELAFFIPEGGQNLQSILKRLAHKNISQRYSFLGTSAWRPLPEGVKSYIKQGWFAAVSLEETESFMARFKAHYGYTPSPLAYLAYEQLRQVTHVLTDDKNFAVETLPVFTQGKIARYPLEIVEISRGNE